MSITDAINTTGELFYIYPEMTVTMGNAGGDPPVVSDEVENLYCTRVVQAASGSKLDYADLSWILTDYMTSRSQPENFTRMIGIYLQDSDQTRLHLGDYVQETEGVSDGEALTARSQLAGYHFGEPLTGYWIWDALDAAEAKLQDDIVFNPTIDNITHPNRSDRFREGFSGYLWTHPEINRTTPGETYQDQTTNDWTLYEACESICQLLNPDEEFITNPTATSLDKLATAQDIRDLRIPLGTRLHQALDMMLIPAGFNWYLNYDTTDKPEITFFKIGTGTEKQLYMQTPGSASNPLDLSTTNVNQYQVDRSIADSFNQVRVFGEFEEAEVTLPLYPGWNEDDDDMTAAELNKEESTYAGKENVWRLFLANEAGDLDTSVSRWGITHDVPNLGAVFDKWFPHRRTLGEPITYQGGLDGDGNPYKQRRPIFCEYSIDAGGTWVPFSEQWSVKLCPDQIGILLDGDEPPSEIVSADDQLRIRITGTVFGDARIEGLATKQSAAVNGRTFEQVIYAPDKFQKRWRQEDGDYASVLAVVDDNTADTRDDQTNIDAYAEIIRDQNHHADMQCEFRLAGWHLEYQIGDLLTDIVGRDISLDAASSTSTTHRYAQVTERRFENGPGGPSTVLIVDRGIDTNRAERFADRMNAYAVARTERTKMR